MSFPLSLWHFESFFMLIGINIIFAVGRSYRIDVSGFLFYFLLYAWLWTNFLACYLEYILDKTFYLPAGCLISLLFWQAPDIQACTSAAAYSSTVFFVFDTICCSDSVCSRIGVALLLFDISLSFHCWTIFIIACIDYLVVGRWLLTLY